ncbi:MAG TPA: hypothetical protein VFS43_09700 [Polyangiaceae bacterium]|nr:hypothetical protein [Polyangiaceae bacterium]
MARYEVFAEVAGALARLGSFETDSPEAAAEAALLGRYGPARPSMAPSRVEVARRDGVTVRPAVVLEVDEWEWEPARIFFKQGGAPAPADLAGRAVAGLARARKALARLAEGSGPEARQARGLVAEIDELGARAGALALDLAARKDVAS